MNATDTRPLPYEGTLQDLRMQAARDAYRGEQAHHRIWDQHRSQPGPLPVDVADPVHVAAAAAGLGWLAAEHPDLAHRAGCMAQDVMINGGNRWCEDIPDPAVEAP